MAEVRLHPGAETDYEDGMAWYLARSPGAAGRFEAAVNDTLRTIAATPEAYPLCDDRHRTAPVTGFPYTVIYRVDGEEVRVVAAAPGLLVGPGLMPGSRRPGSLLPPRLQAEEVPQAEEQDHPDRPQRLLAVHLARPGPAVLEQDRVLAQPAARLVAAEQHLLLERVPARPGPLQVRLPQLADPVAPVRPARVLHRHP